MQSIANKSADVQQTGADIHSLNVVSFNPAIKESKSRQALKLMMEYIAINSMADDLGKAVALSNWKVKAFAAMGDSSDINFAEVM